MTYLDEQFICYEKEINRFAKNKCNGRDEYKDLIQDSYLKMKRAEERGSYKDEGKFKKWILILINNVFKDQFVIRQKIWDSDLIKLDKLHYGKDDSKGTLKNILVSEIDSETEENEAEHIFWLGFKKVYCDLNPIFKEVIDLHTWGGMKHKEIGKKLNVSPMTSIGRYRYGILELRKEFNLK